MGLAPWLWLATVFAGLTWGAVTYANILWFPLMQEEVPGNLLGRVSAVDWMISIGLAPLGTVAGGAAAALVGIRTTLIIGGGIAALTGAVVLIPGVTEPDRRRERAYGSPGPASPRSRPAD